MACGRAGSTYTGQLMTDMKGGRVPMNRARQIIRADAVHAAGITGQGITAVVLDTGAARHPDFIQRMSFFGDFVNGKAAPYDDYGHGTHVTGILAGDGSKSRACRGVAPGASLIHLKVLDQGGNGRRIDVARAIDWVLENRERRQIRILNISVGTVREGDVKDEALIRAVEDAWDAGIVVVVAAGNLGPEPGSITAPGNSRKVITVGSWDEAAPLYSGRGPTAGCVCKPDIVAPGTGIVSCSHSFWKNQRYYCRKSSTSMATPMVSGAIALLLSEEPWLTNVEVKMRLRESARDLGRPHSSQGWGLLDAAALCGVGGS